MKTLLLLTFASAAVLYPCCQASVVTINFDDLPAGTVVTDQYAGLGVRLSLLDNPPTPGPYTTMSEIGNYPLATRPNMITPGDENVVTYHDIDFTFSAPIDFFHIDAFDADEPLTARAYYHDAQNHGVQQLTIYYPPGSNLQRQDVVFGAIGSDALFDRIVLDVSSGSSPSTASGPEYYDNLQFEMAAVFIPEPAQVAWLAACGLAALSVARRVAARGV